VRALIDYRPALRQRSGVGEYTHQLVKALLGAYPADAPGRPLELTLFSSSWKDRLTLADGELPGAATVDRRVPVRLLNLAWHRLAWPKAETLTGRAFDVTHSLHPLMLPSRAAAHVVTIHDLDFLVHPERTRAEIRRDYPALARAHAHRADRVVVPSQFTGGEVERRLGLPSDRISICPPGAPDWTPRERLPADGGYVLFFGTLEPRKNVGSLLDAYERFITGPGPAEAGHYVHRGGDLGAVGNAVRGRDVRRNVPPLVLAGQATEESRPWLDRIARAPLHGVVRHIGYVDPSKRRELYEGARLLVQPSFEEGFGLPVLEAMTLGVPVIAANRGALPEVLGDAGAVVDPERPEQLASAIERMIDDEAFAAACAAKGALRARQFRWDLTARRIYEAYQLAIDCRTRRTQRTT
jgi:glycosyltransferase involved in cell wall biosynthesis